MIKIDRPTLTSTNVWQNEIFVGIDPGQKGGLAMIGQDLVRCTPMPLAGKAIDWAAVADWIARDGSTLFMPPLLAVVEKVGAMPGQGVASTFKFGMNAGGIHGVLAAMHVPMRLVTPPAWKREVLAGTKKDKAAAIAFCRQRWPEISLLATERSRKPHDGMADALCLAEYARRMQ